MSWILMVRPQAEQDAARARTWYERRRPGLGDEFLDALAAAMRILAARPDAEQLYYRNFRRVILKRFPYKLFYQIIGQRVIVFRVLHAKQDHARRLPGRD